MEQRQREPKHPLKLLLQRIHRRPLLIRHLLVYLHRQTHRSTRIATTKPGKIPTSFSPNENTGTKSALPKQHWHPTKSNKKEHIPMLNGDFYEPKPTKEMNENMVSISSTHSPFPQRQIRRPRPRIQTLRRTPHNNRNRRPGPRRQDIRTRLLAHTAYPQRKDDVSVYRRVEIRRER